MDGDEDDTNFIEVVAEVNNGEDTGVKVNEEVVISPIDHADPPNSIHLKVRDHWKFPTSVKNIFMCTH